MARRTLGLKPKYLWHSWHSRVACESFWVDVTVFRYPGIDTAERFFFETDVGHGSLLWDFVYFTCRRLESADFSKAATERVAGGTGREREPGLENENSKDRTEP